MATLGEKVSVFTAAMRTEYLRALAEVQGQPAPKWESYTQVVNSTARIEHYPWMVGPPGLARYRGHRRFANLDVVKYSIENEEFDAGFAVRLRDIEDDQVGGYKMQPAVMMRKAREFPGRLIHQAIADGASSKCFDGTNFFAAAHQIGTGNNLMAFTAAGSNDGTTHKLVVLIKTGFIKPIVFQDRKPLREDSLQTDAGTPESNKAKEVKYWVDTEMAVGYGFWWDAVLMTITNTPDLTDLQKALGEIENRFRTFKLPKALDDDADEYPHEGLEFSRETAVALCSTTISNQMRTVLNSENIVQAGAAVTNVYRGWADLVPSAKLNG